MSQNEPNQKRNALQDRLDRDQTLRIYIIAASPGVGQQYMRLNRLKPTQARMIFTPEYLRMMDSNQVILWIESDAKGRFVFESSSKHVLDEAIELHHAGRIHLRPVRMDTPIEELFDL